MDAHSRKYLTVGEEQYGSELAWSGVFVSETYDGDIMSTNTALAAIKYLIFEEYPGDNYTLSDFKFANSTIDLLRSRHHLLDAVSSDLSNSTRLAASSFCGTAGPTRTFPRERRSPTTKPCRSTWARPH